MAKNSETSVPPIGEISAHEIGYQCRPEYASISLLPKRCPVPPRVHQSSAFMKAKQPIRWTSRSSFPLSTLVARGACRDSSQTATHQNCFSRSSLSPCGRRASSRPSLQISPGAPNTKRTTNSSLDLRFESPNELLESETRARSRFCDPQDVRTKAGPSLETPHSGGGSIGTWVCVMSRRLYAGTVRRWIIPFHGSVLSLPHTRVKKGLRCMIHSL